MKTISDNLAGIGLALLLIAASSTAIAQRVQGCADEDGNPVACEGDGIESADGTGIDSADGTGIDSADGTGIDAEEEPVEEDG